MRETSKAAAAYAAYEAMPDRSLAKLAELLGQNAGKARARIATLERWSAQFHWVQRVTDHDLALIDRERQQHEHANEARARRKAERELRREHERESMDDERAPLMRATWHKALILLTEKLDAKETKGVFGLVALMKHAMDEERLARGGVTSINEQRLAGHDGGELRGLTIITTSVTPADEHKYIQYGHRPIVEADEAP